MFRKCQEVFQSIPPLAVGVALIVVAAWVSLTLIGVNHPFLIACVATALGTATCLANEEMVPTSAMNVRHNAIWLRLTAQQRQALIARKLAACQTVPNNRTSPLLAHPPAFFVHRAQAYKARRMARSARYDLIRVFAGPIEA